VIPKQATVNAWLVRVALAAVIAFVIALGKPPPAAFAEDTDGDGIPDATDNCVTVWNPDQANFDAAGIGNGASIPGDDGTVPNADNLGDACDPDDDNDGLADGSDSDPRGDITYDDNNNGIPCFPDTIDPLDDGPSWDADCNGVLDGMEAICPLTTNPTGDTDGDGLKNTWEVCKWGTDPNVMDSDGDGLEDDVEAMDVNGDGVANCRDSVLVFKAALLPAGTGPGQFGRDGVFDLNGDGSISYGDDAITVARRAGWCSVTVAPSAAINLVGSPHTVTATVTNDSMYYGVTPMIGLVVSFQVNGANAGASGVCTPNADCTTNASGQVSFTYNGFNPGDDSLGASTFIEGFKASGSASKSWETDGDGVPDATDNCVTVPNPDQANFDTDGPPYGNGAGIGNGTSIPGDDGTVPNADNLGDACDDDLDNDGIPNGSDTDPDGDVTYDDNANGDPCVPLGTDGGDDGPSWDADCNGVLDGVEAICPLAVNPNGDDDGDGLLNTWEVCKWGTDPNLVDSDGDGKGDCVEAADVDGNAVVNFTGDTIAYAKAALLAPSAFGRDGDFDIDGNNVINFTGDVIQEAKFAFSVVLCR